MIEPGNKQDFTRKGFQSRIATASPLIKSNECVNEENKLG